MSDAKTCALKITSDGTVLRQDSEDQLDPSGPLPGPLPRNGAATANESAYADASRANKFDDRIRTHDELKTDHFGR